MRWVRLMSEDARSAKIPIKPIRESRVGISDLPQILSESTSSFPKSSKRSNFSTYVLEQSILCIYLRHAHLVYLCTRISVPSFHDKSKRGRSKKQMQVSISMKKAKNTQMKRKNSATTFQCQIKEYDAQIHHPPEEPATHL